MKKNLKCLAIGMTVCALATSGGLTVFAQSDSVSATRGAINSTQMTRGEFGGPRMMRGEFTLEDSEAETGMARYGGMKTQAMNFDSLVASGTIDQATADKMAAYMTEQAAARKADMDSISSLNESERQAYFESKKNDHTDMFAEMVATGVITQTQADAIKAAMPEPTEPFEGGMGFGGRFKLDLSGFVTEGIIDQATADNMSAYMEDLFATKKTEMETIKDMTDSERQAYFENGKDKQKIDFFEQMVADGIVTQKQADAMKAAMPEHPERLEMPEIDN